MGLFLECGQRLYCKMFLLFYYGSQNFCSKKMQEQLSLGREETQQTVFQMENILDLLILSIACLICKISMTFQIMFRNLFKGCLVLCSGFQKGSFHLFLRQSFTCQQRIYQNSLCSLGWSQTVGNSPTSTFLLLGVHM